jgi:predicted nucleotidyltransferase
MDDRWINRFQKEALPRIIEVIGPARVLLFGSRVRGKATEDSDIDVIIVSIFFKDIPFIKRMEKVLTIAKFPKHVDYFCYTPEEFDRIKDSSSVIEDALEEYVEAVF